MPRRKHNVRGRIILENNSIKDKKPPKAKGLAWGTKWDNEEQNLNIKEDKKIHHQIDKDQTITQIIWEVTENT